MTYEQLIAYGHNQLIKYDLNVNLAFKTLFTIDLEINDYDQYMQNRNKIANEQIVAKFKQCLFLLTENSQPFARVFGFDYFLKSKYFVLPSVFIFRSETEILVEHALELINKHKEIKKVADFCSGTGVMGLSLKKQLPFLELTCVEYDMVAVDNIKLNALYHNINIDLVNSDLRDYINQKHTTKYDLIVCNPPYIKQSHHLEETLIKNDPIQALVDFSSENGLSYYQLIIDHIDNLTNTKFAIIFEIGYDQKILLEQLLKEKYVSYNHYFIKDYNNIDRILVLTNLD